MIERDALIIAITGGRPPYRHAEALVDAFAHELAEQQRRIADGWAVAGYAAEADGLRQGADAIDPSVSLASSEETEQ